MQMEIRKRSLTSLLLIWAVLFGAFVRVLPVWQAGFPLNDGGLFFTMISDLQQAGSALPNATTYNRLAIPFAYPPLAFYLAILIQTATRLSLIEVIRWLPVFFSLLTLPAFFVLARALLGDSLKGALATALYALLPRSYEWIIMGGGVTRAPAALFLILMAWAAYRLFRSGGWFNLLLTTVCGALVVLLHPERALHAAVMGVLFCLYFGRSRKGFLRAAGVAAGVAALSAPWWLTGLLRYGWKPFLLAFQSGGSHWLFWSPLLLLNFTDEQIAVTVLLATVGCIACLVRKKTFLPAWLALAFLIDPRSAPHVVPVQTALLAAVGLSEVIFPALARLSGQGAHSDEAAFLTTRSGFWILAYVLLLTLVNGILNVQTLKELVLTPANRIALTWVASETPPDSHFITLGWQENAMLSPLLEWFPALSERNNLSTIQGREWLGGKEHFSTRLSAYPGLYACLYQDASCLERWAAEQGDTFDYVYLDLVPAPGQPPQESALSVSLKQSSQYRLVYASSSVLIFARH
jgi:hypothetical protein